MSKFLMWHENYINVDNINYISKNELSYSGKEGSYTKFVIVIYFASAGGDRSFYFSTEEERDKEFILLVDLINRLYFSL